MKVTSPKAPIYGSLENALTKAQKISAMQKHRPKIKSHPLLRRQELRTLTPSRQPLNGY